MEGGSPMLEATDSESVRRSRNVRPGLRYQPLQVASDPEQDPSPSALWDGHATVLYWCFLGFGIAVRVIRALTDRPIWGDEAMVAVNILDRSFAGLLEPLEFYQVAPVLFLWTTRLSVVLLGTSIWALRLLPIVAGILAVPLFGRLARRAFGIEVAALAMAIFAVSYSPIRHTAEIKPYASDLLASLLLIIPAVAWIRSPHRTRTLWCLILVAPWALAFSHTSAFVAAGVGIGLLPAVVQEYRKRPGFTVLRPWVIYLVTITMTFGFLYYVSTGVQSGAVQADYREGYWSSNFPPPITAPLQLLTWLVSMHTGAAFGYPIGGERGASLVSTILVIVGIIALWNRRDRILLGVLLAPIGMTLLASAMGRYPYGGSARTMQHIAPMICLFMAVGVVRLLALVTNPRRLRRLSWGALGFLGLIGLGILTADLVYPYRTPEDLRSRDFARWFWPEIARDAEVCCVKATLGSTFEGEYWRLGRWELYLVHRELWLPQSSNVGEPDFDRVTADRPLRCVIFNDSTETNPQLRDWLAEMETRYQLRSRQEYHLNEGLVVSGMPRHEHYVVFEFVPIERDLDSPVGLEGTLVQRDFRLKKGRSNP